MMLLCIFTLSGGKNCKETSCLQQWQCIFTLLHLHMCQLSFIQQTLLEMKKNIFNFSDACPLGCKSYFDLFLKKSKHGFHVLTSFLFYIALSNKWSIEHTIDLRFVSLRILAILSYRPKINTLAFTETPQLPKFMTGRVQRKLVLQLAIRASCC